MKRIFTLILCGIISSTIWAQTTDSTKVKLNEKYTEVITDEWGDTTYIKFGGQLYKVIEGDNGKYLNKVKSGQKNQETGEQIDTNQINVGNQSYKVMEDNNGKYVNEVKVGKKNVVTVVEDGNNVHVVVGDKENGKGVEVLTDDWGDTTHIRVGRRTFKVIEGNNGTYVKYEKEDKNKKWSRSFNAHWAGLEVGMNMFENSDYSIYQGTEYEEFGDVFDLRSGKSLSWNINFFEFAFKNEKKTFGLVTGMGISFNDYAFDLPVTLEKEDGYGMTVPKSIKLEDKSVKKSKLHVNYLTVPLLLEVKTPLRMGSSRLSLSAGAIGSLYIGSHSKYKYHDKAKVKIKGNYNINQWKYDLTGRIHFGDFTVFANYSMTSLFENGQGPEIHPLMIGISFPNI
jgi:hypothetical protein